MNEKISISVVASMLGINIQTLRRWDENGILKALRSTKNKSRYYTEEMVKDFLSENYKYLEKTAKEWAFNKTPTKILSKFYCQDKSIFKARLSKLEFNLSKDHILGVDYKFSLITSIVGEIGNNSFDHNIGRWEDAPGIFFGYNLNKRKIILADRGQGILTTLKQVLPELSSNEDALKVAFTEYISGRAPEKRGNGLKYVREVIEGSYDGVNIETLNLYYQSGDAKTLIEFNDNDLDIQNTKDFNKGCFAILSY